jgi:hypothetical protein
MLSALADGLGLGERAYRKVVIEIGFPASPVFSITLGS